MSVAVCLLTTRTSRHESNKFTLFQLMYWQQPMLPIDIEQRMTSPEEVCQAYQSLNEPTMDALLEERTQLLEEAAKHVHEAQQKKNEAYDKKHTNSKRFQVYSLVLKKYFTRKKVRGGKLKKYYVGHLSSPKLFHMFHMGCMSLQM